jgi:uncharacterized glyoxalase superfamily protein PhnB
MTVPYLSYRDANAAIGFLERAFGYEVTLRWDDSAGAVQHAEVRAGDGVVMLGTAEHPEPPLAGQSIGRGIYVVVDAVDEHFARAEAAGATVVYPPEDTEWGTRRYRVLDLEGYEWSFGSYRPGEGSG